jgi:hypothetical protein
VEILLSGGMFRRTLCKSTILSFLVDVTLDSTAQQLITDLSDVILSTDWFKSQLMESIIVSGYVLFKTC